MVTPVVGQSCAATQPVCVYAHVCTCIHLCLYVYVESVVDQMFSIIKLCSMLASVSASMNECIGVHTIVKMGVCTQYYTCVKIYALVS
jgi:hypothetical protein